MSWDIFVQDLPERAQTIDDIPADFVPRTFLPRASIVHAFRELAPFTDFSEPKWWHVECPHFSVEVNIGEEDPSLGFAMHVRGGEEAVGFVHDVLVRLGVRALDPSAAGGIFDRNASLEGFRKWRAFRDSMIGGRV
jgi:hypothetical protein